MSIAQCPDTLTPTTTVTCAICGKRKRLRSMSVGRLGLDFRQTFICSGHADDARELVEGWTDFIVGQRERDTAGRLTHSALVVEQGIFVEHCVPVPERRSPSQHIARHLYARCLEGPALVITDQPKDYLSAVRKQWQRLIWRTQQARASTLLRPRIFELAKQCSDMEHTTMRMLSSPQPKTSVYFAPIGYVAMEDVAQYQTIYVISPLDDTAIAELTDSMAASAVLVCYR